MTCPSCGATVAVPRLGELARLQIAAPRQATVARAWTAAHACLLGGAAVAALAGAAAFFFTTAPVSVMDEATIRRAVAEAPARDVFQAWLSLSRSGVARPALPEEERLQKIAQSSGQIAVVLKAVAAIGALVAATAAFVAWSRSAAGTS